MERTQRWCCLGLAPGRGGVSMRTANLMARPPSSPVLTVADTICRVPPALGDAVLPQERRQRKQGQQLRLEQAGSPCRPAGHTDLHGVTHDCPASVALS